VIHAPERATARRRKRSPSGAGERSELGEIRLAAGVNDQTTPVWSCRRTEAL